MSTQVLGLMGKAQSLTLKGVTASDLDGATSAKKGGVVLPRSSTSHRMGAAERTAGAGPDVARVAARACMPVAGASAPIPDFCSRALTAASSAMPVHTHSRLSIE